MARGNTNLPRRSGAVLEFDIPAKADRIGVNAVDADPAAILIELARKLSLAATVTHHDAIHRSLFRWNDLNQQRF